MSILKIKNEQDEWEEVVSLKGSDGTSPIITTSPVDGGYRITIVDVNGTNHIDIMNGSSGSVTTEQITAAIEEYFRNDPITHVCDVKSVNGKTGDIQLSASDVGALPSDTAIPSIEGLAKETFVTSAIASAIAAYDTDAAAYLDEAMALLGEDEAE